MFCFHIDITYNFRNNFPVYSGSKLRTIYISQYDECRFFSFFIISFSEFYKFCLFKSNNILFYTIRCLVCCISLNSVIVVPLMRVLTESRIRGRQDSSFCKICGTPYASFDRKSHKGSSNAITEAGLGCEAD